jgi:hypothetical protein
VLIVPALGQETTRVSVDSSGAQANQISENSSISADGRYVAFDSAASNLVPGDTNDNIDVFVHDRELGTTTRVSVDSAGGQGDDFCDTSSISADGRFVAFSSMSTNLVPGDTNNASDMFLHDRELGTTIRVSVDSSGGQADGESGGWLSISSDGQYVAFLSNATNLVPGDTNDSSDVFVYDRQSAITTRVSVASSGAQGNDYSCCPSLSADGRFVAFSSSASNLVGSDTNGVDDIFLRDRQSGTTARLSVDSFGVEANQASGFPPSISADGRFVAFESLATNLVSGDTNGVEDVFIRDRQSGSTTRVSVASTGEQAGGPSYLPAISPEGSYVGFTSMASNLVAGDTNSVMDVFVHDRQSAETQRISLDSSDGQGNGESFRASLSAGGAAVAFTSFASNLVPGDTNALIDIFVHRSASVGTEYCTANSNSTGMSAKILASGSSSSASGNLKLDSLPVPNQFGIFFHGASQSQIPFGNGYLCVTDDLQRGSVIHASGQAASYRYDNSDAEHSLSAHVGTTRNFQYWFRDPAAGGAFFNTSNAISIAILP